jgi:hypothetical protein
MGKTKLNFTDTRLNKITHDGSSKRLYFYDSKVDGLRLQVTPAGYKSFQFQMWDKVRQRPVTRSLGKYPTIPITKARQLALDEISAVSDGIDIEDAARQFREEDTFDSVFQRWLEEHAKPHKKSWDEDESRYNLYVDGQLGNKKLSIIMINHICT